MNYELFFGRSGYRRRAFRYIFFRSDTVSLPNSAFDSDSNIRLRKKDAAPIPNALGAPELRLLTKKVETHQRHIVY